MSDTIILKNNSINEEFHFKLYESGKNFLVTHVTTFGSYSRCCPLDYGNKHIQELYQKNYYYCENNEISKFTQ